jgi:FtsP/CotA-like multicopper oxidase with cupredoxin domain
MSGMPGMDMSGGGIGMGLSDSGIDMRALGDGTLVIPGASVTLSGDDPVSGTLPALVNLLADGEGDPGDVTYPLFLINGRPPEDPFSVEVVRNQRIRLRVINTAADTHFVFSVDEHPLMLVASDGQNVSPTKTDGVVLGMGERADLLLDATNPGAYRIIGSPLGKKGRAVATLRYKDARRSAPLPATAATKKRMRVVSYSDLKDAGPRELSGAVREIRLDLRMDMSKPYRWTMGGQSFPEAEMIHLERNEKVRFVVRNKTMMPHPMHLHGHFLTLVDDGAGGPRKDTIVLPPQKIAELEFIADNPGSWMFHCHNLYHQMAGMMRVVEIA